MAHLTNQHNLQHSLTYVIAKGREELSKANNDYMIEVAKAKQIWISEKSVHDAKRLQAILPSKSGVDAEGTPLLKMFLKNPAKSANQQEVGKCLADVIDGSTMVAEGKASDTKFKDFVPPPRPIINKEGEDMAQRQRRLEMEYRSRYNEVTTQLQKTEEARNVAWRKMMKAKADLELYHQAVINGRHQNILVHPNNHSQFPVPSLRGNSSAVPMPRELSRQQSAQVPSYRPPASKNTGSSIYAKYSAEKIRQRKAADGSVAPVSEPKKTEDGLYMRPAGRTRKNMRWDAFGGVWVPQTQS